MTKEQRPTSKIVQMLSDGDLLVLCEDGSIWVKFMDQHLKEFVWECKVEAHKEPETPIEKIRSMPNIEPVEEEPTKGPSLLSGDWDFSDIREDQEPTKETNVSNSTPLKLSKEAQEALNVLKEEVNKLYIDICVPELLSKVNHLINALEAREDKPEYLHFDATDPKTYTTDKSGSISSMGIIKQDKPEGEE